MPRLSLPANAPFSASQKIWLKGFLDGISSALIPTDDAAPAIAAPAGAAVTILWGSQTGTSEALGKKLSKKLAAKGHSATLRDMADVSPADLCTTENLLIITSTYGEGAPPDNAAALHAALHAPDAPSLPALKFAVLALGDSNYPDFCKCGQDFHQRLSALGAQALIPIVEVDVDYDEPFASWSAQLEQVLVAA
jgi:sulfite reductase alpha subunit-like flavoprotein